MSDYEPVTKDVQLTVELPDDVLASVRERLDEDATAGEIHDTVVDHVALSISATDTDGRPVETLVS